MPTITLTSDFGSRDAYVAAMKGVILQISADATLVDVSHEIDPHNVVHGAFVLRQALPWFPAGTIHIAVVDPGVGSRRRILAGRFAGQTVIAPDNGLITLLHRDLPLEEMRVVENRRYMAARIAATFHGRDIMAPVAAHLAQGVPLRELGPSTDRAELLHLPRPVQQPDQRWTGEILYADRFGNLITNISRNDVAMALTHRPNAQVNLDGHIVGPVRTTYADVPPGQPLALVGGTDMLEIAVHGGSARERFGATARSIEIG